MSARTSVVAAVAAYVAGDRGTLLARTRGGPWLPIATNTDAALFSLEEL